MEEMDRRNIFAAFSALPPWRPPQALRVRSRWDR